MDRKIKVKYGDRDVDATPVEVNQSDEHWNSYMLDDRSVLKLKVVVTRVARVDDMYDADGNPVYVIQSTNIAKADAPDSLRKK